MISAARPLTTAALLLVSTAATADAPKRKSAAAPTTPTGPSTEEQITTYSLVATGLLTAILVSPPDHPHWTEPLGYEKAVRNALRWDDVRLSTKVSFACTGSVLATGFVAPLASRHRYDHVLGLELQAVALTQITTTALKVVIARQRPYSHFGTRDPQGLDDNASFPSADTSWTFAMATSSAYLMAREHPAQAPWIWTGALLAGGTAGYMRIAADFHYITDVAVGAAIGTAFGILTPALQYDHYFGREQRTQKKKASHVSWTWGPGPSLAGISVLGSF